VVTVYAGSNPVNYPKFIGKLIMIIWSNKSREFFKNVVIENNIGTLSLPSKNPFNRDFYEQRKLFSNNQLPSANEYKQNNLQLNNGKIANGFFISRLEFSTENKSVTHICPFVIDNIS
jgi:hypothetical protein